MRRFHFFGSSRLTFGFSRSFDLAFRLHLVARHAATDARRSNHELCLEIYVADGVHLRHRRGGLALYRSRLARLALVGGRNRVRLFHLVDLARDEKEIRAAHLSLRRMSAVAFVIIAILTLAAALAVATLRKLMHAALSFAVMFLGISAFFFLLGAEFVGLVQVFVYIGAVAVLIVFTFLLTRHDVGKVRGFNWSGVFVAVAVFGGLVWTISKTKSLSIVPQQIKPVTVQRIGELLMTNYVWPLQCVGVLLTAALIGALILVMEEKN